MSHAPPQPTIGDAFGVALLHAFGGGDGLYVIERDDGFVEVLDAADYLAGPEIWPEVDRAALELVAGRVLDVGAGAGRHSLALRRRGHEPVALDVSPGAIEVCSRRGVEQTFLGSITDLTVDQADAFDAIIMMGNNLALLESTEKSRALLDTLRGLLRAGGTVVGTCLDPYLTANPIHLGYHRLNRDRDRMAGQVRMRARRHLVASEWFDYLFLSPDELRQIAARADWQITHVTEPNPIYLAVLTPA